jgi:hypothetical protein
LFSCCISGMQVLIYYIIYSFIIYKIEKEIL